MVLTERLCAALQNKWLRIVLPPLILGLLVAAAAAVDFACFRGKIYPGVYLQEIPLGRMSLQAAEDKLNAGLFSLKEITLSGSENETVTVPLSSLGISYDRPGTMEALRRAGTGCSGYPGRLCRLFRGAPLRLQGKLNVHGGRLEQALKELAEEMEKAPQEPFIRVYGASVIIEEEREGRSLMKNELREQLLGAVRKGQNELTLPLAKREPEQCASRLASLELEQVMVAFSTTVSPSLSGRVHNIKLGAEAVNSAILAPGEIFSFEAAIGEISRERGYREAPVIVGEELHPGLGGGLCQVSSTLYNAALLANLEIVERHNHNLPISYLPLGRDATISTGWADLKFKNNRDHHLLIGAELSEGLLTIRLFGPPMEERVEIFSSDIVRTEPPVRYEDDQTLPVGEKELLQTGKPGYTVKTWRAVYRGKEEISRELLSHDRYRPTTSVYRIGVTPPTADPVSLAAFGIYL